ncbi:translation initiation factor IF-2 [Eubacterium oxidoreducens]|uniref:Translation initiation factor IF-2 n=1 Tax=Eubacterium oxidoreducens TaxID=1732 RepID=A0A1G6ANU1_EUBOX|nr:translation initiation factor IF-2 [Eubacterium oxidoreducens]SDB09987.1 translation initiation factor IF-2 [Eubacterium oxidoreducens]
MARIHEIAKELNISAKDIIAYLEEIGIVGKKSQSGIDDDEIQKVKKHFGAAKTSSADEGAQDEEKKTAANKAEDDKERPKKKSSITAVFNPQNTKSGGQGRRNNNNQGRNSERRRRRSEDDGSFRPGFQRATAPVPRANKERNANAQNTSMEQNKTKTPNTTEQNKQGMPEKKNVQKIASIASQTTNVRKQGNIFDSLKKQERDGQRKNTSSERGQRTDRNGKNDFSNNQPRRENNRNDGNRGGRGNFDRQKNSGKSFGKDLGGFSQGASSGEGKRNERGRDNNRKNRKDYDNNSRRQERYVNLEKHGGKKKHKQPQQPKQEVDKDVIRTITLPDSITIKDLADILKVQASAIVKQLFMQGKMVTVNQEVDFDEAEEIALEYNCICEHEVKVDVIEELLKEEEEDEALMKPRPAVVCVMGHVDHGKTSLLDAIRKTNVTDREAGGITQHIGASVVKINDQTITFLDTPGHEAFTAMRMRGANSTDIAILVVAADDGVMPQTIEAINHAKAAGVEIIVAINKIDKPSANIERVKQELSEYELIPEDWGGSTIFVPVSAHTGEGIDQLLEMILLTSEILELKANPNRNARGLVIESQLDKGRGVVATVLVQKGTLKVGEPIAAGSAYGKVRAMLDDKGRRVRVATPSTPVEILGLSNVPNAGEIFVSMDNEKEARSFAETFISQGKEKLLEETKKKMSLEDLYSSIQEGNLKELDIVVKADVQGSVEAVKQSLEKLSNEEVVVKVIHGGVGAINESDIILASASNAIVIGFNVRPDASAKTTAEQEGVDVRLYKVIYNAIEDVQEAMKGMLDPIFEEKVIGHAEIRQIFKASGVGNIAGSYILDGSFERDCLIRISREGEQIYEGKLASLKRFKDDVKEVKAGYECGLVFEDFNDFAEMDIVEGYKMVEVPR